MSSQPPPEAFVRAAQQRASKAFDLLHPAVQRWIWKQGWSELRDIQEDSIPLLLAGERDVIIAASTASGKTEAAFLPIVSRLVERDPVVRGFKAIYVSPLRALINDQFRRLEALCEELEVPVFKWHGDVSQSQKARARTKPDGILLITPESLEAILIRRGPEARGLFHAAGWIVIDELHAYLDSPRGKQLQSLLHRIEFVAQRRTQRIGLSATLADKRMAAEFMRPLEGHKAEVLQSQEGSREIRIQVRGYINPEHVEPGGTGSTAGAETAPAVAGAQAQIANDIFKVLHGHRNLVFANARAAVELYTADLSDLCEAAGLPTEFLAHHGNLSREYREEAERRMKNDDLPATIVCTSTLELGIDIGHIDSIAQIGCAHTVSGLRQRLGRSGRRPGKAAILRQYITAEALSSRIHPLDALRPDLVQAIAMINLLLDGWNEPIDAQKLHLSTLLHQILALIVQYGGITAEQGHRLLIKSGVFPIETPLYKQLLRRMAEPDTGLLEQAPDGTLLLGPEGERLTSAHDFYAVFQTPTEYRVIASARTLGTLPVDDPLLYTAGSLMIFGGRRWIVEDVLPAERAIMVRPAAGGRPPKFGGGIGGLVDGVISAMLDVYRQEDVPRYLAPTAVELLGQARSAFAQYRLSDTALMEHGTSLILFPWIGAKSQLALALALRRTGLKVEMSHFALEFPDTSLNDLRSSLSMIADGPELDPVELTEELEDLTLDKFDHFLSKDLQRLNFSRAILDSGVIPRICGELHEHLNRFEGSSRV